MRITSSISDTACLSRFIARTALTGTLVLAAAGACAPAQTAAAVAIENTNASFTATDVITPQANPARPTVTIPARLPPTGYVQFEQGFNQANSSPSSLTAQSALLQTTKLALTTRLMVQFITEPFAHSSVRSSPSGTTASNDAGDLLLGGQAVVHKSVGILPAVDVGYLRRVRAGSSPSLDAGSYSQSALLFLGGDLPGSPHYDSNLIIDEQNSGPVRRPQFTQTLALSHPLFPAATRKSLSGIVELSHFTQPLLESPTTPRANAVDLLFGAAVSLRPNLIADAAFSHGLTSTSIQWQGTFGLSYLLPHRLWPDTHPRVLPVGRAN